MSGGQRQGVAVARSVMWNSKVVLLDEPTAALGVAQTAQVLNLIKRLRERGLGVVVISHNLADVFDVADRIIVLRLGRRVATFDTQTVNQEQVVGAITGAVFGTPNGDRLPDQGGDGIGEDEMQQAKTPADAPEVRAGRCDPRASPEREPAGAPSRGQLPARDVGVGADCHRLPGGQQQLPQPR